MDETALRPPEQTGGRETCRPSHPKMSTPVPTPPSALPGSRESVEYWKGVCASVDGMLGGIPSTRTFSCINRVDLQGSRAFLAKLGIGLKSDRRRIDSVLEFGAGIGRVTEGLFLPIAEQIDIVEPVAKFTNALQGKTQVRQIFNVPLQEWHPNEDSMYDLIWIQWCLCYASDDELTENLRRCSLALKKGGIIVVKENLSTSGTDMIDASDNSITREDGKFRDLFKEAGLQVIRAEMQNGFPKSFPRKLLPVKMYALKPFHRPADEQDSLERDGPA